MKLMSITNRLWYFSDHLLCCDPIPVQLCGASLHAESRNYWPLFTDNTFLSFVRGVTTYFTCTPSETAVLGMPSHQTGELALKQTISAIEVTRLAQKNSFILETHKMALTLMPSNIWHAGMTSEALWWSLLKLFQSDLISLKISYAQSGTHFQCSFEKYHHTHRLTHTCHLDSKKNH